MGIDNALRAARGMEDPKIAAVIAHYDPTGKVSQSLLGLVHHFRACGIEIIFVSTNLDLAFKKTLSSTAKVITRPNLGYDFYSYKLGIENLQDIGLLDRLILLNSSFITLDPEKLLKDFISKPQGPALRGLTLSYDTAPHIQSFWLSFETQDLIGSPIFQQWWANVVPLATKEEIIRNYEIGLSQWFSYHHIPLCAPISSPKRMRLKPAIQDISDASKQYVTEVVQVYEKLPELNTPQEGLKRLKKLLDPAKVWAHLVYINPIRPRRYLYLIKTHWNRAKKEFITFNPAHDAWMLVYRRFAILKIGLIAHNPTNQNLRPFYEHASATELALVEDALGQQ